MGTSLVSRHYRELIKCLERKGIFEGMSPEKVKVLKEEIHETIKTTSRDTWYKKL